MKKKTLSLVLTLALCLGFCTMVTHADADVDPLHPGETIDFSWGSGSFASIEFWVEKGGWYSFTPSVESRRLGVWIPSHTEIPPVDVSGFWNNGSYYVEFPEGIDIYELYVYDEIPYVTVNYYGVNLPDLKIWEIEDGTLIKYAGPGGAVTIPSSVTSISNSAFFCDTGLTSVTIPASVEWIEGGVFDGCSSLTTIQIDPGNQFYTAVDGVIFSKDMETLVACSPVKQGEYIIPDSVTRIKERAFSSFENLTSVTIPDSVTVIGEYAFFDCSGLTSINIPSSMDHIPWGAFAYCTSLTSMTIPNSVTSIDEEAFHGCVGLTSVTIPNSVTSIEHIAFEGTSLTDVYYGGTEAQWKAIQIGDDNAPLINANIHYNSEPPAPGLHGKISLSFGDKQSSSGVAYVPGDVVVTIHAAPDPGYQLSVIRVVRNDNGQQVPLSGSGNTRTFRMPPADVSIQAEFSLR